MRLFCGQALKMPGKDRPVLPQTGETVRKSISSITMKLVQEASTGCSTLYLSLQPQGSAYCSEKEPARQKSSLSIRRRVKVNFTRLLFDTMTAQETEST
jgi:hypothetical protein